VLAEQSLILLQSQLGVLAEQEAELALPAHHLLLHRYSAALPRGCSRKDTGKTARTLALKAQQNGEQALFDCTLEEVGGRAAAVHGGDLLLLYGEGPKAHNRAPSTCACLPPLMWPVPAVCCRPTPTCRRT
jgi:hypothetical protein